MSSIADMQQIVRDAWPDLTPSERRIVQYLLHNYDEAALLPAAAVASLMSVHEATVVRLARSLGFRGYSELRSYMQEVVRSRIPANVKGNASGLLQTSVDKMAAYLQEATSSISESDAERAVSLISNARRTFFLGLGSSAALVKLIAFRGRRLGLDTYTLTRSGRDMVEDLAQLQPQDVLIAVRFRNLQRSFQQALQYAGQIGCPCILITDVLGSMLNESPTVVLSARRAPLDGFNSSIVPLAILEALLSGIALSNPERTHQAADHLQRLRSLTQSAGPGPVQDS